MLRSGSRHYKSPLARASGGFVSSLWVAARFPHRAGVEICAECDRDGKLQSVCLVELGHGTNGEISGFTIYGHWYYQTSQGTFA